jgi:hypothetical protein
LSYLIVNSGKRFTSKGHVDCLIGATGLTGGPVTMRLREVGQTWSSWISYVPYFSLPITDTLEQKDIEVEITDTVDTVSHVVTIEKIQVDNNAPWRPETQLIANNLPMYHVGRRLRSSNWQTFVNGLASSYAEIEADRRRLLNSRYVQTTPLDEPSWVTTRYVDRELLNSERDENDNLLLNPTLSLLETPFSQPYWWGLTGDWKVDSTSILGANGVSCAPDEDQLCTVTQRIDRRFHTNEPLILGLFYSTDLPSTTASFGDVDYSIEVTVLYEDGASELFRSVLLPGTDDRLQLHTMDFTPSDHVTRMYVSVIVRGQPTVSPFDFRIAGLQLREGLSLGSFNLGRTFNPSLNSPSTNALNLDKECWFTESRREFYYDLLPTSIDPPVVSNSDTYTVDDTLYTAYRITTAQLDSATIAYRPVNGGVGLWIDDPEELMLTFKVAFWDSHIMGWVQHDGFIVEATRFFQRKLWAVGYFDEVSDLDRIQGVKSYLSWGSPVDTTDRVRYLVQLEHLPAATPESYMKARNVQPLVVLDKNDSVLNLIFRNSDGRYVYHQTADTERVNRLKYDYAYSPESGVVWFKEYEVMEEVV